MSTEANNPKLTDVTARSPGANSEERSLSGATPDVRDPTYELALAAISNTDKERAAEDARARLGNADRGSGLASIDLSNFMAKPKYSTPFVIESLIPLGVVTLLGGHGGAGKSILAAHVACGRPWAGLKARAGDALYVSLEDPEFIVISRLQEITHEYNLDAVAIENNLRILDGSHGDGALVQETYIEGVRSAKTTALYSALVSHMEGTKLVVIDNASDAFSGDENSRLQVRFFIRLLTQAARCRSTSVLLLAHIDKAAARSRGSAGDNYSGSTAWHNSARSRLSLPRTDESGVELHHEKSNLGALMNEPLQLDWSIKGVLTPHVRDPAAEIAKLAKQTKEDAAALLNLIKLAIDAGEQVPTASAGPKQTHHVLKHLPEYRQAFSGRGERDRLRAAAMELMRTNLIVKKVVKSTSRNTKEIFVLTEPTRGSHHQSIKEA